MAARTTEKTLYNSEWHGSGQSSLEGDQRRDGQAHRCEEDWDTAYQTWFSQGFWITFIFKSISFILLKHWKISNLELNPYVQMAAGQIVEYDFQKVRKIESDYWKHGFAFRFYSTRKPSTKILKSCKLVSSETCSYSTMIPTWRIVTSLIPRYGRAFDKA